MKKLLPINSALSRQKMMKVVKSVTKDQRVTAALQHKPTDFIPYQIEFDGTAKSKMSEYLCDEQFESKWDARHISVLTFDGRPRPIDGCKGFFRDDYGVVWDRTGEDKVLGAVREPLIPDITQSTYSFPALDRETLKQECCTFFESITDRFAIASLGLAVYERAWTLHGIANLLYSMKNHPYETTVLFEQITENALEIIDTFAEFSFKAFFVGDDWTVGSQLEMGEKNWRTFIKPVLQRIYERTHRHGMFTIQHSCGNISAVLPDLIEIGLDCYQTVQPEEYNLGWLKKEFGKDLAFWGGLSTKKYLPVCNAAEAKEHTIVALRTLGAGNGYIAAPSHILTADIDPEAIFAVLDVFQNQNQYL